MCGGLTAATEACEGAGTGGDADAATSRDADGETPDAFPDYFPDLGEIPDGHVYFMLSYERGECPYEAIYVQEYLQPWRDESGTLVELRLQE
ncbi:MAG: hypothetical protein HY905_01945 [Deltaproteobacteria bacterium]|nr:hypothetical protein [Deltaproteobacteria bacterium]